MMWERKVELNLAKLFCYKLVFCKLLSSIRSDRFKKLTLQRTDDDFVDWIGFLGNRFYAKKIPVLSIRHCYETGFSGLASHSISFPVSQPGSLFCFFWPFRDRMADLYLSAPFLVILSVTAFTPVSEFPDSTSVSV